MCFGSQDTTQTVEQRPAPRSPEEQEAAKLALQSLQGRQALMPFILGNLGYQWNPENQSMTQLETPLLQGRIMGLSDTALKGSDEAAQLLMQRLRMSQGMLPGLLRSVQASMPQISGLNMPRLG